ncbi:MAG: nickel pincer cofactor biosynthesis protein LarC [Actinobacteria bacterium]|nr:nickel pincer cofactor biosynthesis protein LarC [Actinomycetota bacterium]
MAHVHFQPVGGAAGDMILAALVSAGAPLEAVSGTLETLGVPFELRAEPAEVGGIRALRISVVHPEEQTHRTFRDVRALIEGAALSDRTARRAIEAFRRLAVAEGTVHGLQPEEVTFHEVGAIDSIVDTVGSCVGLELLRTESVSCGPLPMGSGTVPSTHGPLPVPGPATLEVLKGSRVLWTENGERTTPTGAALMAALTGGEFTDAAPPMTLRGAGYGAGRASFGDVPNVLRAIVGELEAAAGDVVLLEANIDDAPGEILGAAVERLLNEGALDAWLEPIVMKRGRGAYKVCALAEAAGRENLARLLMRETGALGVRHRRVGRTVAERRRVEVELPYGRCRVKVGSIDGEDFVVAPEYADAVRLAEKANLPLPRVYDDAKSSYQRSAVSSPPGP